MTKKVDVVLNGRNISHFESKGYTIPRYLDKKNRLCVKCGSILTVDVCDLSNGSHTKVDVRCDYCGKVKNISYKDYISHHDNTYGDCCHECEGIKYSNTMMRRYGVNNSSQLPWALEKTKDTNRKRYGYDWHMQRPEFMEQVKETNLCKYGVEHILQNDEFLEKMLATRSENNNSPTSKPQKELAVILEEMYGKCIMEVPCGKCSIDCFVEIGDIKIDVEYDGQFWHQDKNRDIKRDNFMKSQGYKVLRVKANKKDDMPTTEQISEKINQLINGYNYAEIIVM